MPRQTANNSTFPSFKKIATIFIVLAIILLVFIIYFSFAKATIILTLSQEPKTLSFDLTVSPTSTQGDLIGNIVSQELKISQKFEVKNFSEQPDIATGKIRIINNHTKNQPLIKTTRFLSLEGILFRLEKNVLVPAGGEIIADVYADKEGVGSNIGPTRFTIPGLSTILQQKIYGVSDQPMTGGIKKVGVLTQADVDASQQKFLDNIDTEIKNQLSDYLESGEIILDNLIKKEILSQKVSNEIGEQVESFSLTNKVLAQVVLVDYEDLLAQAKEIYKQKLANKTQILNWQIDDFNYEIKSLDLENNKAVISAKLTAEVASSFDLDKFDKKEIAGFDKKGIEYYFSQYPEVKAVEVKFWPFWVKSVPALADRIIIEVK